MCFFCTFSIPSFGSLWAPFGLLWPPFGLPLAPFWLLWLPFGLPFRSFDLPLVPFWSRNPSGIYTPFRFSPNQGHVRTLPQAHDIYISARGLLANERVCHLATPPSTSIITFYYITFYYTFYYISFLQLFFRLSTLR